MYPIIKAVDPTSTVVAGAVGATQNGPFTMDPVTFVTRMLAALGPDALNFFDALSVHPYGVASWSTPCPTCSPGILTPKEQVEAIMALIGGKQVWLSEYGAASTDAASAATQAAWIKDLLDHWQDYDQAGPVFLYTGRDYSGTEGGEQMGIWTESGGEKYYTYTDPDTGQTITKSVSQMLKDWITAHPMPGNPGNPGTPVNPIAALVQALVAGVQALVTAVVTAITNFLGGLAGVLSAPAAVAAPLALRSASVVSAETEGLAAESDATEADGKAADVTEKAATDETATETTATEETATEETATEETATEETATEETATEETATAETPAEAAETAALPAVAATETATATVPVKATEPATATEPVKTEPVKTEPVKTEPTGTTTETEFDRNLYRFNDFRVVDRGWQVRRIGQVR